MRGTGELTSFSLTADHAVETATGTTVSISIGENAPTTMYFTVTASGGTATPGTEYGNGSYSLMIAQGSSSGSITIPLYDDGDEEDDENFIITASLDGATAGDTLSVTAWIYDDDLASTPGTPDGYALEVRYGYDYMNRLVRRVALEWDAVVEHENFEYDRGQVVLRRDENGDVQNRYLWGSAVDQLLADEQVDHSGGTSNVLFPMTDHLGTIRDIGDVVPDGGGGYEFGVVTHRRYDAFGNLIDETGTTFDPATGTWTPGGSPVDLIFGYTGRYYDERAGLQNNWNRWYDPVIGQWMSEDPIGFAAGDANVRRYVGNVAISLKDPDGLQAAKPLTTGNYTEVKVAAGAFRYNFAILNNDVKHGITSQIEFHPNLDNNPGEIDLIQVVRTTDTKTKEHWDISENALSGRRDDRSVCVDQRTKKDPKGKYEADWWVDVRPENWAKKFKSPYYNDTLIYKGWTGKKGLVDLSGTTRPCIARDQPATSDFVWGVTYEFETVVVNRDTGEVLGALKWGFDVIKYKSGKWSVVPAPTKASDNASATFYATVNKFYDKFNPGTTLFGPE